MKCIHKKRIYKPITKLLAYKDTFTYITKSNKQFIHPNKELKIPFTPQDFIIFEDKFYYITKNNLTVCENDNYSRVRLPVKITSINILNEQIIACEKKIMKLENEKINEQLYGPTMPITCTDTFENMILATCFGCYSIYLFRDKNHAVYDCDELINFCCFLNDEFFYVSSDNKLYLYDVNKRTALKSFEIRDITFLKNINGEVYVGNIEGEIYKSKEREMNKIIAVDGIVNDLLIWNEQLVVASGSEARHGRHTKRSCKNMISIYK